MTNVYVKDRSLYVRMREAFEKRIRIGMDFPADVRVDRRDSIVWVSSDDWRRGLFFGFISELSRFLHAEWWGVLVMEPDPERYFYHHFSCYPAILGNDFSSQQEYLAAISADPGGSLADSITDNSGVVVAGDGTGRWAAYFNRDFELGVFVLHDMELPPYPYDTFADPVAAASNLLPDDGAHLMSHSEFKQLVSNYSAA